MIHFQRLIPTLRMGGWRQDRDLSVTHGCAEAVFQRQREFSVEFSGRGLDDEFDEVVGHRAVDDFAIVHQHLLADAPSGNRLLHALKTTMF